MRFLRVVCALLIASVCALASAQDSAKAAASAAPAPPAPLSKGEIKAMRDFKLLDFNGDSKISRTEVALFPRLAAAFSDADTNGDNYLSYEEVRAYAVVYRAERERQRAAQTPQAQSGKEAEKKP